MKSFGSAVTYIHNAKPIPAIVLKSQNTVNGELLTLLYADPDTGPGLIAQGTSRGIGQVATAVPPMASGNVFGWQEAESTVADAEAEKKLAAAQAKISELRKGNDYLIVEVDKLKADLAAKTPPPKK